MSPAYEEGDIFMSPDLRGGWHIDFGADPIGISIGVTLSCLHNILWACGWILTKFSWTYNWNITKNWLDFGDLDLIFKVTAVEKLKIHCWGDICYLWKHLLLFFPRNKSNIHANCLYWRQCAWNVKSCFLGKNITNLLLNYLIMNCLIKRFKCIF